MISSPQRSYSLSRLYFKGFVLYLLTVRTLSIEQLCNIGRSKCTECMAILVQPSRKSGATINIHIEVHGYLEMARCFNVYR